MYEALQQILDGSRRIVFFGGAGVSTESGIPDFRSVDGLYHRKYDWPPETMLSRSFFFRHTAQFFDFYREKMIHLDAQPNACHRKLAELENRDDSSKLRDSKVVEYSPVKTKKTDKVAEDVQMSLFDLTPDPIITRLRELDLMNVTPSEAIKILEELKRKI